MTHFYFILLLLFSSWFSYLSGELEVADLSDTPPSIENVYRDQTFNEEELLKVVDELSVELTEHTERAVVSEAAVQKRQDYHYPNGLCPPATARDWYDDSDEDRSCNAKWGHHSPLVRTFASAGSVCAGTFRRITCACCYTDLPITDNNVRGRTEFHKESSYTNQVY